MFSSSYRARKAGLAIAVVVCAVLGSLFGAYAAYDYVGATGTNTQSNTPTCPFVGENVYDFDGYRLVVDRGLNETSRSVSLPAGKYAIEYYSYDMYEDRPQANLYQQTQEQWNLILKNAQGGVIAEFGPTKDLPDGVVLGEATGVFTTGADINEPIRTLVAQHVLYPSDKNPHSVVPGCVKFEKIEEPRPEPVRPVCPWNGSADQIVVSFSERVRSDKALSDATSDTVAANVPAGTYDVWLASWDGYNGRETVTQPREQWYASLASNGAEVGRTQTTPDLADYQREVFEQFNAGELAVNQSANQVTVQHAFYPDKTSPNSVTPICAKFIKKTPAPAPDPICTLTSLRTTLEEGESTILTWGSQNTKTATLNGETVALSGTRFVAPTETTTYTAVFANAEGNTVTCEKTITVTKKPEVKLPVCTMTLTPSTIVRGESVELSWTSDHATNAGIDQNIGTVALDGGMSLVPQQTTTYTGTFKNSEGKSVTCTASVTVTEPETPPQRPVCPIAEKEDRTIVYFAERIRSDKDLADAQTERIDTVLPKGTYSVTLASWDGYLGRENVTQPHESYKVIVGNDNGYLSGTNVSTDLADMVREDLKVTPVHNGNFEVTEAVSFVYGEHAVYPDKASPNSLNPLCAAFDLIEEEVPAPICSLNVSDALVAPGDTVELTWTSDNTTAASFNAGIGSVATAGSATTTVNETTTFIGTFTGENGDTVTCKQTVKVEEPETPEAPICALNVNPSSITSESQQVTLTWSSENAVSGSIDQGVGSVELNGSTTTIPAGARTYTGTFIGEDDQEVTCTASVVFTRGGGGGGGGGGRGPCLNCGSNDDDDDPEPVIEVAKKVVQATPGSFIYLDQVPYTGISMGPIATTLYWIGLFALSASLSYLIVVKGIFGRLATNRVAQPVADETTTTEYTSPFADNAGYQLQTADHATETDNDESAVEAQAHAEGILFSPEALAMVEAAVGKEGAELVHELIALAKETFPREDGWILISKDRARILLARRASRKQAAENGHRQESEESKEAVTTVEEVQTPFVSVTKEVTHQQPVVARFAQEAVPTQSQVSVPTNVEQQPVKGGGEVADFVGNLVSGNQAAVFEKVRNVTGQGKSADAFIGAVIRELDDVYKYRLEGDRQPNKALVQATAMWSNGDFETVLGILVESIDHSYASSRIGTKVALAKAFEYFEKKSR